MREKIVRLYKFDELSDKAKEKAREWWREAEAEEFGRDSDFYEPYQTAAKLLGIELATHEVGLMGGGKRNDPKIWWTLHVQGSGASFEGYYNYAKQCSKKVREEFPTDTALQTIADGLTELQKKHGYKLSAKISTSGNDTHKYAMSAEVYKDGCEFWESEVPDAVLELMRDFADWIYKGIQEEYDYRMEDEYVDDAILANEYDFTEDGKRED